MSFVDDTRQNILPLATRSYTAGQSFSQDIDHIGFLATITIRFKGTLTCTHASKTTFTKAPEAPWNLIKRIELVLNSGISIWNTSGYGAYVKNLLDRYHSRIDEIITGSTHFQFENVVSSGGTANDLEFTLKLNVSPNDRDLLALLPLQSDQVLATLKIDCDSAGVLMTETDITTSLTGSFYMSTEFFDLPSDQKNNMPVLNSVHQVLEETVSLYSTGENRIVIPRGNTYMKIINIIKLNGTLNSADIDSIALKTNLTKQPYKVSGGDFQYMHVDRYGRPLPTGTFVHDFFFQGLPNLGNHRDLFNSDEVSEFDQFITVSSSATLGASNNTVRVIREMLVDVQPANK